MGQIQYSFDPTRDYELKDLFVFLNKYYDYIPDNPQKLRSANYGVSSDKDRKINELNELLKHNQKDVEGKDKELESLRSKLKEAEGYAKLLDDKIKQKEDRINRLMSENALKEKELQERYTESINSIKIEKEQEIAKLSKELDDLRKRLSVYEPSLIGDTGEDKFFVFSKYNLDETLDASAPIIGKVDGEGNAIYQFNVEKGHHKENIMRINELSDFFEIVDRIDEANHIGMGEWGKAKYNNGTMVVIAKAKIKLTRE